MPINNTSGEKLGVFSILVQIYKRALDYDLDDVEANFNLAGIYLQRQEFDLALRHFVAAVRKDEMPGYPEIKTLFA